MIYRFKYILGGEIHLKSIEICTSLPAALKFGQAPETLGYKPNYGTGSPHHKLQNYYQKYKINYLNYKTSLVYVFGKLEAS
jgi:hypothetical protein